MHHSLSKAIIEVPAVKTRAFDISDFVSDQALSLVGVSWFIAKPDEFTRYQSVTSGGNVTSLRLCYALSGHPAGTDDLSDVSSSL